MFTVDKSAFKDQLLTTFCGLGPEAFERVTDWVEQIPEFEHTLTGSSAGSMSVYFTIQLKVELVEETAKRLGMDVKAFMDYYGLDSNSRGYRYENELKQRLNVFGDAVRRDIDYRGCRTEESKRKKYEKIRADLRDEVAQRKADIERAMYVAANLSIAHQVVYRNGRLIERHVSHLSEGGWSDYVDGKNDTITKLKSEVEDLQAKRDKLNKQIKQVEADIRTERCKTLVESLEDPEANGNLPVDLREALIDTVNSGEAFKVGESFSPFFG